MADEIPPGPPPLTSKIPKATHRQLRDYAHAIEAHRAGLFSIRERLVEDIEETEAVLRALQTQLSDIDRTLHTVPTGV